MSDASEIMSFFACKSCVNAMQRSRLHIGLTNSTTVRVWCATCHSVVADLTLAHPMPLRCDVCGGEMHKGHKH